MAKVRSILLVIVGIISIGLSVSCFQKETGSRESRSVYGGDAFTGIQNAGARTASNVKDLAEIVKYGFGSILLVGGLSLIVLAIPGGSKEQKAEPTPEVATQCQGTITEEQA